jgi:DUF1365 family protein
MKWFFNSVPFHSGELSGISRFNSVPFHSEDHFQGSAKPLNAVLDNFEAPPAGLIYKALLGVAQCSPNLIYKALLGVAQCSPKLFYRAFLNYPCRALGDQVRSKKFH